MASWYSCEAIDGSIIADCLNRGDIEISFWAGELIADPETSSWDRTRLIAEGASNFDDSNFLYGDYFGYDPTISDAVQNASIGAVIAKSARIFSGYI